MRRALFAVFAVGAIGTATVLGLHPVWFALAKLGVEERIVDWAFWQQSMPAVAIALLVGATGLMVADRRPRIAMALLPASPVVAFVAAHLILGLTL